jgi:hypothetical protein
LRMDGKNEAVSHIYTMQQEVSIKWPLQLGYWVLHTSIAIFKGSYFVCFAMKLVLFKKLATLKYRMFDKLINISCWNTYNFRCTK